VWKDLLRPISSFVVLIERCNMWKQLEINWIYRKNYLEVKNNDTSNMADSPVKIFDLWEIFRDNTQTESLSLRNLFKIKFISASRQSGICPLLHRSNRHDLFTPKLWVLYFRFRCKRRYWSCRQTRGAPEMLITWQTVFSQSKVSSYLPCPHICSSSGDEGKMNVTVQW
jgi:hypothetical protein